MPKMKRLSLSPEMIEELETALTQVASDLPLTEAELTLLADRSGGNASVDRIVLMNPTILIDDLEDDYFTKWGVSRPVLRDALAKLNPLQVLGLQARVRAFYDDDQEGA